MPSIPQSLLWISLVVLWLFVLVPMLISKRDAVRRTSDVALATRVLNTGRNTRLLRRGGPAAGHRSDPDWCPSEDDLDDSDLDDGDLDGADDLDDDRDEHTPSRSVVVAAAVTEDAESEYLDVDVIEDSGALPVGAPVDNEADDEAGEIDEADEFDETDEFDEVDEADEVDEDENSQLSLDLDEPAPDGTADEYEYVEDSSGLEAPSDADLRMADSMAAARRRRRESSTAAAVSERKYRFRKRMLAALSLALVGSAAAGFLLSPAAWWVCGTVGTVTVLYLAYLRRQTRIEERLRRRRAQRMARSRLGVESTNDREFDLVPARLRRPGSVVLEIDDEDPIFEHLDYAPFARGFDLPRAAGQ